MAKGIESYSAIQRIIDKKMMEDAAEHCNPTYSERGEFSRWPDKVYFNRTSSRKVSWDLYWGNPERLWSDPATFDYNNYALPHPNSYMNRSSSFQPRGETNMRTLYEAYIVSEENEVTHVPAFVASCERNARDKVILGSGLTADEIEKNHIVIRTIERLPMQHGE